MIISRTPFRISFFGGGTDYAGWYREHGGAVLATTINKYCYITCRHLPPFFEHRTSVVWSEVERVNDVSEIRHPSVRESLNFMGIKEGVAIHTDGDLPARSGLGSSSSFTVGLLNALYALKGTMVNKMQLARDAIQVEQERLREHVGVQDQITTAVGGFNHIRLHPGDRFEVEPVVLPDARVQALQDHLLLFFSGVSRRASEVAAAQVEAIAQRQSELRAIQQTVDAAMRILTGAEELEAFGRLLHEAWQLKRSLTGRITTPEIDDMYDTARRAGAIGGKLLGAGGGGFILLFVRPEDQPAVRERLRKLLWVPFAFERQGSQIIFYEPEGAEAQPAQPVHKKAAHAVS